MKRETRSWSAMKRRLKALGTSDVRDPVNEWFMPLDRGPHRAAWREVCGKLHGDCVYVGTRGNEGVAWDFPVIPRMKLALKHAEAVSVEKPDDPGLKIVIDDLRSYRDTGYSARSPEKPKS